MSPSLIIFGDDRESRGPCQDLFREICHRLGERPRSPPPGSGTGFAGSPRAGPAPLRPPPRPGHPGPPDDNGCHRRWPAPRWASARSRPQVAALTSALWSRRPVNASSSRRTASLGRPRLASESLDPGSRAGPMPTTARGRDGAKVRLARGSGKPQSAGGQVVGRHPPAGGPGADARPMLP